MDWDVGNKKVNYGSRPAPAGASECRREPANAGECRRELANAGECRREPANAGECRREAMILLGSMETGFRSSICSARTAAGAWPLPRRLRRSPNSSHRDFSSEVPMAQALSRHHRKPRPIGGTSPPSGLACDGTSISGEPRLCQRGTGDDRGTFVLLAARRETGAIQQMDRRMGTSGPNATFHSCICGKVQHPARRKAASV
jgi:hypothetical protein